MEIILLFPKFSRGGAEKAALSYFKNLTRFCDATLLASGKVYQSYDNSLHVADESKSLFSLRLLRYIFTQSPDMVITFKGHAFIIPVLYICRFFKEKKFKILMRESNDVMGFLTYELESSFRRFCFKYFLKRFPAQICDMVICNSNGSADSFKELTGISRSKLKVIWNPSLEPNFKIKNEVKARQFDFMFLGRLENQKDPLLFIECMANLIKHRPNLNAVIVGSGTLESAVKKEIEKKHLAKNIKTVPFSKSNAEKYLGISKILFITSRYEGMPNVMFEAVKFGCLTVSLNFRSGPGEFLEKKQIISEKDPDKISKILSETLSKMPLYFVEANRSKLIKLTSKKIFENSIIDLCKMK